MAKYRKNMPKISSDFDINEFFRNLEFYLRMMSIAKIKHLMVLKCGRWSFVLLLFFCFHSMGQKVLQEKAIVKVDFPANVIVGEEYIINIQIDGSLAEGPGRFSVVLPDGFALQKDFESIGDASAHNQFVNVVWAAFPKDQVFNDSFRIIALKPSKGTHEIEWRFTFLSYGDFETLRFTDEIKVASGNQADYVDIRRSNRSVEPNVNNTSSQSGNRTSFSDRGNAQRVEYYVQISSSESAGKSEALRNQFNLQYPITIIKVGNLNKYNVGPFRNYQGALDYCKELNSNYNAGSFVVKYKGNERIK